LGLGVDIYTHMGNNGHMNTTQTNPTITFHKADGHYNAYLASTFLGTVKAEREVTPVFAGNACYSHATTARTVWTFEAAPHNQWAFAAGASHIKFRTRKAAGQRMAQMFMDALAAV